jgi:hypothetical protein
MQNFVRDVVVQLKFKHGRERVVVIVCRSIVDVRFGGGVAKLFAARFRRFNALKIADVFPPARIPLIHRQIARVDVGLPVRHDAAGKINKRHRARECVVQKERKLIGLEIGR